MHIEICMYKTNSIDVIVIHSSVTNVGPNFEIILFQVHGKELHVSAIN